MNNNDNQIRNNLLRATRLEGCGRLRKKTKRITEEETNVLQEILETQLN